MRTACSSSPSPSPHIGWIVLDMKRRRRKSTLAVAEYASDDAQ